MGIGIHPQTKHSLAAAQDVDTVLMGQLSGMSQSLLKWLKPEHLPKEMQGSSVVATEGHDVFTPYVNDLDLQILASRWHALHCNLVPVNSNVITFKTYYGVGMMEIKSLPKKKRLKICEISAVSQ